MVHAWDLRRAARLDETLDPLLVVDLMRVVEPHLQEMLVYGAYGRGPSARAPQAIRRIDLDIGHDLEVVRRTTALARKPYEVPKSPHSSTLTGAPNRASQPLSRTKVR
jgi:hypothetical protein